MQFEITTDFLEQLEEAVESKNEEYVKGSLGSIHPADIAEVLNRFKVNDVKYIFQFLSKETAADVLVELEEDFREKFLKECTPTEIAGYFVDFVESDDAADILNNLPGKIKEEVLRIIVKEDVEQASDIADLLNYDEDTAGGLMAKELVSVQLDWGTKKGLEEIRQQVKDVEQIYSVYVVDENNLLKGWVPVKKLILLRDNETIREAMEEEVVFVKVNMSGEEVAHIMQKYDLVVVPVIDEVGRLVGRVTIDDVVDFIRDEAEKDYQMVSGITEDIEVYDSVWRVTRARLPWLLIGIAGGIIGAKSIGVFEEQISNNPEMAFFVPLIAAMGGNVGVQSSSIVVQGLANNSIQGKAIIPKLMKELVVALLNGLICAAVVFAYNYFFSNNFMLTVTVSVSLFSIIMFASAFGTLIPLTLNKYKIDPALATGPFITTINDILGIIMYFYIGQSIYTYLA